MNRITRVFPSHLHLVRIVAAFKALAQDAGSALRVLAYPEARPHRRALSTTRNISQGGVSLLDERWEAGTKNLSGRSAVIGGNPCVLTVNLAEGFRMKNALVGGGKAGFVGKTATATIRIVRSSVMTVEWKMARAQ